MRKQITTGIVAVSLLTSPLVALGHDGYHPKPHPTDSPNYHAVDDSGYSVQEETISTNQDSLIQLLIMLILAKMAELGLGSNINDLLDDDTDS